MATLIRALIDESDYDAFCEMFSNSLPATYQLFIGSRDSETLDFKIGGPPQIETVRHRLVRPHHLAAYLSLHAGARCNLISLDHCACELLESDDRLAAVRQPSSRRRRAGAE